MARSSWKIPYINPVIMEDLTRLQKTIDSIHALDPEDFNTEQDGIQNHKATGLNKLTIQSRDSVITNSMLGLTVQVYNGNKYLSFKVGPEHIGHKFGEFSHTRRILAHKEVKKKKLVKK